MISNYPQVRLGDVISINASTYSEKENWEYVDYLDTGNITENKISDIQRLYPSQDKLLSRARRKVKKNDIIYSTVRPNQKHYGLMKEISPNPALDALEFREMTDQWLDFIADCRNGSSHSHDIVSGAMANDQIWNYVADFISGILTREQFWVLAKFKHPTNQLAFCSQNALKCLVFKESRRIKQ